MPAVADDCVEAGGICGSGAGEVSMTLYGGETKSVLGNGSHGERTERELELRMNRFE